MIMFHRQISVKNCLAPVLCAVALVSTAIPTVRADQLAEYRFTNSTLSSTDDNQRSIASDIAFNNLTQSFIPGAGGVAGNGLGITADQTNANFGGTFGPNTPYFSFTLAPTTGNAFTLNNFSADLVVSGGTNGNFTSTVSLYASVNNSAYAQVAQQPLTQAGNSAYSTFAFDLSSFNGNAAIQNGGTLNIRVVVTDSNNVATNYTGFDNLVLNGMVKAVPEPGSLAALTSGAVVVGAFFLRRKKAA